MLALPSRATRTNVHHWCLSKSNMEGPCLSSECRSVLAGYTTSDFQASGFWAMAMPWRSHAHWATGSRRLVPRGCPLGALGSGSMGWWRQGEVAAIMGSDFVGVHCAELFSLIDDADDQYVLPWQQFVYLLYWESKRVIIIVVCCTWSLHRGLHWLCTRHTQDRLLRIAVSTFHHMQGPWVCSPSCRCRHVAGELRDLPCSLQLVDFVFCEMWAAELQPRDEVPYDLAHLPSRSLSQSTSRVVLRVRGLCRSRREMRQGVHAWLQSGHRGAEVSWELLALVAVEFARLINWNKRSENRSSTRHQSPQSPQTWTTNWLIVQSVLVHVACSSFCSGKKIFCCMYQYNVVRCNLL